MSDTTINPETTSAPEAPVEAKKAYDLGAPFGVVEMTPSEYAAFTKKFLQSDETKAVIKSDKIQMGESDAEAEKRRQAEAALLTAENIRIFAMAGLSTVSECVKKITSVFRKGSGQTDCYVNFIHPVTGLSSYMGSYVPKGKNTDEQIEALRDQALVSLAHSAALIETLRGKELPVHEVAKSEAAAEETDEASSGEVETPASETSETESK